MYAKSVSRPRKEVGRHMIKWVKVVTGLPGVEKNSHNWQATVAKGDTDTSMGSDGDLSWQLNKWIMSHKLWSVFGHSPNSSHFRETKITFYMVGNYWGEKRLCSGPEVSFAFLERKKKKKESTFHFAVHFCCHYVKTGVQATLTHPGQFSTHISSCESSEVQIWISAADNRFIICLSTCDSLVCILQVWDSRCYFWQWTPVENLYTS